MTMNDIFGALMALCFVLCNIPQIYKIIKNKSCNDISLITCVTICFGNLFGIIYSEGQINNFWSILSFGISFFFCAIICGCCIKNKFKRKRVKYEEVNRKSAKVIR